jgi:hypothetical protein
MNAVNSKAPVHLWIIGILALLWNAMGAFDYTATQMKLDFYMSQFTAEQLDYFYGYPAWADAVWAIAVWGSLLASLGLLLRKAWSVALFGIALIAMALSAIYTMGMTDGLEIMGAEAGIFTAVIWVIAIGLFLYARAMKRRSVLS